MNVSTRKEHLPRVYTSAARACMHRTSINGDFKKIQFVFHISIELVKPAHTHAYIHRFLISWMHYNGSFFLFSFFSSECVWSVMEKFFFSSMKMQMCINKTSVWILVKYCKKKQGFENAKAREVCVKEIYMNLICTYCMYKCIILSF